MTSVTDIARRVGGSDFARLSREIRGAGLLDRWRVYCVIRMVLNLAVFAGGWVVFVTVGDSGWQLVTAVFFAVMFTH